MIRRFKSAGLFLLLAALISQLGLMAQTRPITGTVVSSENKLPLQGVTVTVKGTKTGTTTDANGNFRISAGENDVLIFSNVSFTSTEVTVGKNSSLNITLISDAKAMEDVVLLVTRPYGGETCWLPFPLLVLKI